MAISLTPETEQLIESRMKELGSDSPDEFLRWTIQQAYPGETAAYEDLDPETRAAIDEADGQEGVRWEDVKDELFKRYGGQ
jgi:hypothetical protein